MLYLGTSGSNEVFVETLETLEKIFSSSGESHDPAYSESERRMKARKELEEMKLKTLKEIEEILGIKNSRSSM